MAVRGLLLCLLKLLNFILLVSGISVIVYSGWIYKEWNQGNSISEPSSSSAITSGLLAHEGKFDPSQIHLNQAFDTLSNREPIPWFIYATFGAGVFIVVVTLTGACAAESENSACFSCYETGLLFLIIVQAALAGFFFFDKSWERDLPEDRTGQAQKVKDFILQNFEICKWIGVSILIIELLALIIAIALRSLATRAPFSEEEEIIDSVAVSEEVPVLPQYYAVPQFAPSGSVGRTADPKSDAWRIRMVEKYGLDPNEFAHNPQRPVGSVRPVPAEKSVCDIL